MSVSELLTWADEVLAPAAKLAYAGEGVRCGRTLPLLRRQGFLQDEGGTEHGACKVRIC